MRTLPIPASLLAAIALAGAMAVSALAEKRKLTTEERVDILRGMMAEYATAKALLPRSKKALPYQSTGTYDKAVWEEAGREYGPAARVGDMIQVSKVKIEDDKIELEINGGMKGGRKWYERIEVGMGSRTSPISNPQITAPSGTTIALLFPKESPPVSAAEVKKLLAPILDFEKRTATESYVESLPEPIQNAIKEERALEGMNQEQVILALGKPRHKIRETRDGLELEDWVYGLPPGKITFVTFNGSKVVKVKEAYAGLGGSVADPLPPK